ncbi:transcriptional regulator, TetR family [Halobacillus dabanensis]|uniref:Transcriptional regulator, TetR family n=1 Tax=Halobacillus dabanensis TaxID=240302 RepID=A0A1I3Z855_HALDA|nr:TetR/AcrR family transcriptional regulator [Halobacillus dabanensis]SFK40217.1 transcriptional regulator, TetR family [Halobacillus dabanensis]
MEQKSIYIIEQSIKLFAQKGFSSTSVQEIANACGMSKGAFYLHFKSKDALLLQIFNYYYQRIQVRMEDIQNLDVDERTKFTKQLQVTFEEIADHREFIIMQIREQAIPFNENIEEFLTQMRINSYLFYKKHLESIYKERIQSSIWEVSLMLQGIFKGYMDLVIIEGANLDFEALSEAMVKRADYIVDGFINHNDQPVIDEKIMKQTIPQVFQSDEKESIVEELDELAIREEQQDVKDTIHVLIEEINRETPRPAIIKALLSNLQTDSRFGKLVKHIQSYYRLT